MYTDAITSAQILYRAITHVGPANKADRQIMMDLLIKVNAMEVTKLYQHLVRWDYSRLRLAKYGFQTPDCNLMLESLKVVCQSFKKTADRGLYPWTRLALFGLWQWII